MGQKGQNFLTRMDYLKRYGHYVDYRLSYRCAQLLAKGTAIMHILHRIKEKEKGKQEKGQNYCRVKETMESPYSTATASALLLVLSSPNRSLPFPSCITFKPSKSLLHQTRLEICLN
jgi:hypothetical protein